MAERTRIGIIFSYNENWIGGFYYVLNIIKSLNALEEEKKPYLVICYNNGTPKNVFSEINYKHLLLANTDEISIWKRRLFFRAEKYFNRNLLFSYLIRKYKIDYFFPVNGYSAGYKNLTGKIYFWIPDFQHKFLPELFTKDDIESRDCSFGGIADNAKNLVLSSYDAKSHFNKFYSQSKAKIHILQFASIIDFRKITPYEELKVKYEITEPFFLIANQFWQHKNHIVLFKALKLLKERNQIIHLVCTGKKEDYRSNTYFSELTDFIKNNQLSEQVKILGFISREDQLGLMQNCIAIIQPSKFEGWGTVVEDAKTLRKELILSDIPVHHEQVPEGKSFFMPDDYIALAEFIQEYQLKTRLIVNLNQVELDFRIKSFANNFIEMFRKER